MIAISGFLVFACVFLAGSIFIEFFKTRGQLYTRISRLAPGSLIDQPNHKTKRIRKLSKQDAELVDFELTELVEMLAAILLTGESLFLAIKRLTIISKSKLANHFAILLQRVDLGGDLTGELGALCERIPTDSMREFTNKLSLAIARGTPLANSLTALSTSLRARYRAAILRKAGVNETKMLIPVVLLICPVTIIFALYPSSQFLALGLN